jgi:hypothetical protein
MSTTAQTNQPQPTPLPQRADEMLSKIAAFIRNYVVVSDEQLFVLTI